MRLPNFRIGEGLSCSVRGGSLSLVWPISGGMLRPVVKEEAGSWARGGRQWFYERMLDVDGQGATCLAAGMASVPLRRRGKGWEGCLEHCTLLFGKCEASASLWHRIEGRFLSIYLGSYRSPNWRGGTTRRNARMIRRGLENPSGQGAWRHWEGRG